MPRDDEDFLEDEEEDEEEEDETEEPEAYEDIYETGAPGRQDIATETFETGAPGPPAPLPRPPGVAPDIGRKSYMEALGRIQYPEMQPLPQYPTGKPGFKGAMMDALRGMIPGYTQGMQAAYKMRAADVAMQNKQRMDLFKEQMDFVRPMMQKDYEAEAHFQKVQRNREYLKRMYPQMTDHEIEAYANGKIPRAAQRPRIGTPLTAVFDDNSRQPVAYGDLEGGTLGLIDLRTGKPLDPKLQSRVTAIERLETPREQKPEEYKGLIIPEGLPGAGGPGTKVVHPDGRVEWFPEWKREPDVDYEGRALRHETARLTNELTRQRIASREMSEYPPEVQTKIDKATKEFADSKQVQYYQDVAKGVDYITNADIYNPAAQMAVIYHLAKILDPRTGVKGQEYETIERNVDTLIKHVGLNIARSILHKGPLSKSALDLIKKEAPNMAKPYLKLYDEYRQSARQRIKSWTGKNVGEKFLPDIAEPYERRVVKNGKLFRISPLSGQPEEITEEGVTYVQDPATKVISKVEARATP